MKKLTASELGRMNKQLQGISPAEIIQWVVDNVQYPVVIVGSGALDWAIVKSCSALNLGSTCLSINQNPGLIKRMNQFKEALDRDLSRSSGLTRRKLLPLQAPGGADGCLP